MAGNYKTPGVYVEEISVFPPSVAEVETAVPAFVGYTEFARRNAAGDLNQVPTKIYSLKEYQQYFGGPKVDDIAISVGTNASTQQLEVSSLTLPDVQHILYFAVKMYFDNGGGQCYIVSVGTYGQVESDDLGTVDEEDLLAGLAALELEDEPTLLVIPEAVKLESTPYQTVVQAMLLQCNVLGDRFCIFDIHGGDVDLTPDARSAARGLFGNNYLKYGAAYYPFVRSSLNYHIRRDDVVPANDESNVLVTVNGVQRTLAQLRDGFTIAAVADDPNTTADEAVAEQVISPDTGTYNFVKAILKERYVVMPPSGAVAGVYAATDNNRGVWKAPANVSVADVIEPTVRINDVKQAEYNVDSTSGKSINVLRSFAGKGTLVWGSRTLAGNDNEWRYVPVRRFYNMVEESVKKSTSWAVFEPNDANTWVKVRGMIENYLTQKWREGALAGATTKEAFFVRCGLGTTMNAQDVLEGRMIVEIGMAVVRPAEFIILRFSHKLQTS